MVEDHGNNITHNPSDPANIHHVDKFFSSCQRHRTMLCSKNCFEFEGHKEQYEGQPLRREEFFKIDMMSRPKEDNDYK